MKKLFLGFAAAIALATITVWISFNSWREALAAGLEQGSTVVATGSGYVEYAYLGDGPVLAVLHGTPGGYDQLTDGVTMPEFVPASMSLLAISRPGYLRTPLSSGKTPEQQADLLAALVKTLGLGSIVVAGVSGGGPAAIQYALRHPDKTDGLVLISARTKSHPVTDDGEPSTVDRIRSIVGTDFLIWLLGDRIARSFADGEADSATLERLRRIVLSSALIDRRAEGRRNDVHNVTNPRIDSWPLDTITVPTLIVYGADDPGVSPQESEHAYRLIPNAQKAVLHGGHFVGVTQPDRVKQLISSFLAQNSSNAAAGS